jgi:hypothetical protein
MLGRSPSGGGAGNAAEHRPIHQSGTAWVVEIKDPADQFARRE